MGEFLLYPIGCTKSCITAANILNNTGFSLTDHPCPEITHLLLDIPSFNNLGQLRDGSDPAELLRRLPGTITVIGGNLTHKSLTAYRTMDLLTDPEFLAKNAAITAECALQTAAPYLATTYADTSVLILGWGRIGKCLAKLLSAIGASVTVAARNANDRAMIQALGHGAVDFSAIPGTISRYGVVFNTVPHLPFPEDPFTGCNGCIKIDLASTPGMDGWDAVTARGLPGKYAPETTGRLIAHTILRKTREDSL